MRCDELLRLMPSHWIGDGGGPKAVHLRRNVKQQYVVLSCGSSNCSVQSPNHRRGGTRNKAVQGAEQRRLGGNQGLLDDLCTVALARQPPQSLQLQNARLYRRFNL